MLSHEISMLNGSETSSPPNPQLGNVFAGVVLMALTYAVCFGEMGKKMFTPAA